MFFFVAISKTYDNISNTALHMYDLLGCVYFLILLIPVSKEALDKNLNSWKCPLPLVSHRLVISKSRDMTWSHTSRTFLYYENKFQSKDNEFIFTVFTSAVATPVLSES